MAERVVLLGTDGTATRAIYHALGATGLDVRAIFEHPVSKGALLRGRARRFGMFTAFGQALFQGGVVPWLRARSRGRVETIERTRGLDVRPIPADRLEQIESVNAPEAAARIAALRPAVVVLSGTRILSAATLAGISVPVINMHSGITPFCRGVHGAYWALADRRPDLVGTTVHYVDRGIDTGGIIAQATFVPEADDDFSTYPALHTAAGLPLLVDAVTRAARGTPPAVIPAPAVPSILRTHPTLWGYWSRRWRAGVR